CHSIPTVSTVTRSRRKPPYSKLILLGLPLLARPPPLARTPRGADLKRTRPVGAQDTHRRPALRPHEPQRPRPAPFVAQGFPSPPGSTGRPCPPVGNESRGRGNLQGHQRGQGSSEVRRSAKRLKDAPAAGSINSIMIDLQPDS